MKKEDIYPGRLLYNLKVKDVTREGDYLLIRPSDDPEAIEFCIAYKYSDKKKMLKPGDMVEGPVVVLEGTLLPYQAALKNYSEALFKAVYTKGWNTIVFNIPWMDLWKAAFDPDMVPEGPRLEKKEYWEIKLPWAIIPVQASKYLKYMKGRKYFFPEDLFSNKKKEHHQYAVYSPQTKKSLWPKRYRGHLRAKDYAGKLVNQKVRICLHPFLDPLRLHYKSWKHLTDDRRVSKFASSLKRWNAFSGMNVPENLAGIVFNNCVPPPLPKNLAKQPWRCLDNCPKAQFEAVNRKMAYYNQEYLRHAVTFFQKCPTNNISMYWNTNYQVVIFDNVLFHRKEPFHDGKDTHILLVLRGYCFNWHQRNTEEPVIHLHIITFYAGSEDDIQVSSSSQRIPGILAKGSITTLEEEETAS